MGRKKLQMEEKARALTLLEKGDFVIAVARDIGVSREAIYQSKRAAALLPTGMVPKRKCGSGAPKKTSPRTDKLLKREVTSYPSITAVELKNKHPELLHNVSTRTIRHRLQKDLGLPCRRAAKKPMLTAAMKKKRFNFCKKYRHWTATEWRKVMFSDESTFTLVRGVSKMVRRLSTASRYDPKFTVKSVKHPRSVMVWGAFSGNLGRAGLYFLPKNTPMRGSIDVLKDHLLTFWKIHQCDYFMQDGAPAHRSKIVTKFLEDNNIRVLEWLGNSPDLNPIENAWNFLKNKIQEKRPNNINDLQQELKKLWVTLDSTYFASLADSMPKRLQMVINSKGEMTKY